MRPRKQNLEITNARGLGQLALAVPHGYAAT